MAMIKCPECGKELSDKASACPNCGCPIEDIKRQIEEKETEAAEKIKEKEAEKKAKQIAFETKKQERVEAIKAMQPKNKKKAALIGVIVAVVVIAIAVCGWYFGIKVPHDKAVDAYLTSVQQYGEAVDKYNESIEAYNDKAKEIIAKNDNLIAKVDEAQSLIDCGDVPFEGEKLTYLSNTVKDARNNKVETPELKERANEVVVHEDILSSKKAEIEEATAANDFGTEECYANIPAVDKEKESLVIPDYSEIIKKLETESKELSDSYAIQKQITAPTEEWILTRLGRVENIANTAPVTEEHDPNGNLNKDGGYTSTVYFSTVLLKTSELSGDALIDKGTDAGGAVEVYRSSDEAEARNTYLSAFDGSILAPGSHKVLGTIVIRTSDTLKASEQQVLTDAIVEAFIALD